MAWYSVRCLFEWGTGTYEERITMWEASSFEEAIALAEAEAVKYAAETVTPQYIGLAQCYEISDGRPQAGDEIYSLLRDSDLQADEYLSSFFDTGRERQG